VDLHGHLWTPFGHLRIRRLGIRVPPGVLGKTPTRSRVLPVARRRVSAQRLITFRSHFAASSTGYVPVVLQAGDHREMLSGR
jgi:hypothetical protein